MSVPGFFSSPLLLLGVVVFLVVAGLLLIRGERKPPGTGVSITCANPRCRCANKATAKHCRRCGDALN